MLRFYNKLKPFILVFLCIILLLPLSFINTEFEVSVIKFRDINILPNIELILHGKTEDEKSFVFTERDTTGLRTFDIDTLAALFFRLDMDSIQALDQKDLRINNFSTSQTLFARFFPALQSVRDSAHKTRVAYFGDSMIEGDLISQSLRNELQKIYGGKGVGFVPITSIVSEYRRSIHHKFSGDWQEYSILRGRDGLNFGPAGFVFNPRILTPEELNSTHRPQNVSHVTYYAPYDYYPSLSRFYTTKLYYGKAKEGSYVKYYIDGEENKAFLEGSDVVNKLILN